MNKWKVCGVLVSMAMALPAVAQTPVTPGSVVEGGVVTLGTGSTPTASPYGGATASVPSSAAAATTGVAGGSSSGTTSIGAGTTGQTIPARIGGGASASASTGGTSSGTAPSWVLCPPTGAPGTQPFLTGTSLSCAP